MPSIAIFNETRLNYKDIGAIVDYISSDTKNRRNGFKKWYILKTKDGYVRVYIKTKRQIESFRVEYCADFMANVPKYFKEEN